MMGCLNNNTSSTGGGGGTAITSRLVLLGCCCGGAATCKAAARFVLETVNFGSLQISMSLVLMVVIVLAGLVGTARMILGAHTPPELYGGYLVGFVLCRQEVL